MWLPLRCCESRMTNRLARRQVPWTIGISLILLTTEMAVTSRTYIVDASVLYFSPSKAYRTDACRRVNCRPVNCKPETTQPRISLISMVTIGSTTPLTIIVLHHCIVVLLPVRRYCCLLLASLRLLLVDTIDSLSICTYLLPRFYTLSPLNNSIQRAGPLYHRIISPFIAPRNASPSPFPPCQEHGHRLDSRARRRAELHRDACGDRVSNESTQVTSFRHSQILIGIM